MKIQLKRSNVLEGGKAKAPTAAQTEYGEICVNYNTADPVLFIKDSSNQIVRVTNTKEVNDGTISVEVGDGLVATGDNASANQATNTVRTITPVAQAGYGIDIEAAGFRIGDSWTSIPTLP